jgi:putative tricarboxylic transport membrane protein
MTTTPTWLRGRSELGMAALLGAVGGVVIWDATSIPTTYSQADPVGPRTLPFLVGGLLLACAVLLAVDVLRGGQGEAEGGEDIDLTHPTEWRVVVPLIGFLVLNILLVDRLGWVVSGAILFWGCTWTLGSRHYLRDAVVSIGMALASFYLFYAGLGIHLPAGILEGVL